MAVMRVLYATGGAGMDKVRGISVNVGNAPFVVNDENYGQQSYRGQPRVSGIVITEDATSACALPIATAANTAFTVVTAGGTGTITILGFRVLGYDTALGDGTVGGDIPGYAMRYDGVLSTAATMQTAATHAAV